MIQILPKCAVFVFSLSLGKLQMSYLFTDTKPTKVLEGNEGLWYSLSVPDAKFLVSKHRRSVKIE